MPISLFTKTVGFSLQQNTTTLYRAPTGPTKKAFTFFPIWSLELRPQNTLWCVKSGPRLLNLHTNDFYKSNAVIECCSFALSTNRHTKNIQDKRSFSDNLQIISILSLKHNLGGYFTCYLHAHLAPYELSCFYFDVNPHRGRLNIFWCKWSDAGLQWTCGCFSLTSPSRLKKKKKRRGKKKGRPARLLPFSGTSHWIRKAARRRSGAAGMLPPTQEGSKRRGDPAIVPMRTKMNA